MNKLISRSLAGAVGLAAVGTVLVSSGTASADPGDPITGGTTTFAVPAATALGGAVAGIVAIPTSPATFTYDQTNRNAVYTLPVSGGDGSVNAFFGSVKNAGGIIIVDAKTKKSVTLSNLSFSLTDLTVSATTPASPNPLVVADVNGSHTFASVPATGSQTFTGTDVQLDAAGAAVLDKALGTTALKAGQHLGSFTTTFTNTQY